MIYAFLFILAVSSAKVSSLSDDEIKRSRDAAVEYLQLSNNWELKEDTTVAEACLKYRIEEDKFSTYSKEAYNTVLKKLYEKADEVKNVEESFFGDKPEEHFNKFIQGLEGLNTNWPSLTGGKKKNVIDYLNGLLQGNDFEKSLVGRLARILPKDVNDNDKKGLYKALRDSLGGIKDLFLKEANSKSEKVNEYKELVYAILELSNVKENEYCKQNSNELDDDKKAYEEVIKACDEGEDIGVLQGKTEAALKVFDKTWVKLANNQHSPDKDALNDYFAKEKEENNSYFVWLKNYIPTIVTFEAGGLYEYLKKQIGS